jgi:rhodanese-related sulfurtransferase
MVASYDLDEPFTRVPPSGARDLIADGAVVIDVRQPEEYALGRVAGARLVPLAGLLVDPRSALADAGAIGGRNEAPTVLFVCSVGVRSALAAEMAASIGLEKVYSLEGGLVAWAASGLPTER